MKPVILSLFALLMASASAHAEVTCKNKSNDSIFKSGKHAKQAASAATKAEAVARANATK